MNKTGQTPYRIFKRIVTIGVILGSIGLIMLMYIKPGLADVLSYEDGLVEWLSAILLALASVTMLFSAVFLIKRRRILQAFIALILAIVFIIISLEEISWGQRILDIESNEFFLENNIQGETNLHNINTNLTEAIYYTGAFILLVALPFFRKQAAAILNKLKLGVLKLFLPAAWLFLPFTVIAGLTGKGRLVWVYVFVMFTATLIMLGMRLASQLSKSNVRKVWLQAALTFAMMIIVAWSMYLSNYFDYSAYWLRTWMVTEWSEMFIALGIFAYSVGALVNALSSKPYSKIAK